MIVDSTATDMLKLIDLDRFRPVEVRTAGDIKLPPRRSVLRIVGSAERQAESPTVKMSPWLMDAMEIISAQRKNAIKDSAAEPNATALLDDAEMLAALLAGSDPSRRPQVNILSDGRPSFATSTKDCYIDITIDQPKRLTWYAMIDGREYFSEDVPFDGRRIPQEIRELLSA